MNYAQRIISTLAVAGLCLSTLVGCAKGSSGNANGGNFANVTVNGNSSSASLSVNGQVIGMSVSNLNMVNSGFGYSNSGLLNANLNIGGQPASLNVNVVTPSTYQQAQCGSAGNYTLCATAMCIDTACTNVGLVLWATQANQLQYQGNPQWEQMGIIVNLSNGTVRAGSATVGTVGNNGYGGTLPVATQLIASLQAVMQ